MSGVAAADCAAELAALEDGAFAAAGGGVAKDGTLAPLEQPGEAGTGGSDAGAPQADAGAGGAPAGETDGRIAKDGTTAPLEGEPGGAAPDIAMSPQDVEAQQEGGRTAMAEAEADDAGPTHDEALDAAREAMARGDEAGCMAAVRAAKGL
jgi:hypothetical protein